MLQKTSFSFLELIDGCCNHIPMSGTHYVEKVGDMTTSIYADQHMIEQVMINLLNKTVKYTPNSKNIIISIEGFDGFIKVIITDEGVGIPRENFSSIFKRFEKVDNVNNGQSGLGMGLFVCSEIIKRHGGEIGVESVLGQGVVLVHLT